MARSPSRRDDRHPRSRRDEHGFSRDVGPPYASPFHLRRDLITGQRYYDDQRTTDRHHDRSRPPSNDRRSIDRHYGRLDRQSDDYRPRSDRYDRYDRPRDRSRDYRDRHNRKRSRERSPVRDRNERSRRDDDYEDNRSKRYRREESPRRARRNEGRDRSPRSSGARRDEVRIPSSQLQQIASLTGQPTRPSTAEDEEKRAKEERLAKVAAWKKKLQEKNPDLVVSSAKKESQDLNITTSAVDSPAAVSQATTGPSSPTIKDEAPSSPQQYAGKFDPKAIAKRAAAPTEKTKALGGDVAIPNPTKPTQGANGLNGPVTNRSGTAPAGGMNGKAYFSVPAMPQPMLTAPLEVSKSALNLNKAGAPKMSAGTALKAAATFGDDDEVERKLEKLPNLPEASEEADFDPLRPSLAEEWEVIQSDEEEAEAAREAAQRRAQEAQRVEQPDAMVTDGQETGAKDVEMEDEVDPLDAYMNDLVPDVSNTSQNLAIGGSKKSQPQMFDSDDEIDLEALTNNAEDIMKLTKKKKKDIPIVDHSKVTYEPFRKAFYSEATELADISEDDVAILRAELENITVNGNDIPKPVLKWSQCGFSAQILDVIRDMGFEKPTPIQSQTLPAIMSGRDTIGIAKTGSGKTVAYLLPMFRHIKDQRPLENLEGPIGLVLAPTRELATQIHRECKPYIKALNLRAVCAYGGAPIKDQIAELKRGAEIVVCTPGRMIDLLAANSGRVINLRRVTYVVLDEADRMFDMGFEPQMTRIIGNTRPDRQTVVFSATFPPKMESLARRVLTKPISITVGGRSIVPDEITQIIEVRDEKSKEKRLLQLLGDLLTDDEDARVLIFVERQETADSIMRTLGKRGYPSVSIHGGRDQIDRDQAISDFKAGILSIMIATSVAARGLDVKQLKLVVNYDCPNHREDYVHRAGRTGRAGNKGTAVTFVTPEQGRFASFLIKALEDSKVEIPEDLRTLAEEHKKLVKAGDAKDARSGFGGRGIDRIDAARAAERIRERRFFKTEDDPEDEEEREEKEKKENEIDKLVAKATGQVKDRDADRNSVANSGDGMSSELTNHLKNAMKVQKAVTPPPAKPGSNASKDALARVSAAAASIENRLGARGTTRPGAPPENKGPDAGAFHSILEINDFPQKARWAVTNRTNVAKILESTGTSITTKGNYYPPGKNPEPNEQPKLYILVEGDTEVVVSQAMSELTRLLREGWKQAMEQESRAPTGRYSVV